MTNLVVVGAEPSATLLPVWESRFSHIYMNHYMNIAIYRLFISSIMSLNPCLVIIKAEVLEVGESAKIPLSKPTQGRQSKRPPQSPTLWNKYHLTTSRPF